MYKDYGSTSSGAHHRETTHLLAESAATARENEEIAMRTGGVLRDQHDILSSTNNNVKDMKNISESAAVSIRQIENRTLRRRLCLWGVILFLFVANIVVFVRLVKNDGKLFTPGQEHHLGPLHRPGGRAP